MNNFILASKTWHLAIYLPLLVGDKCRRTARNGNPIVLLDVLKICMAHIVSSDLVEYLRVLIHMYLESFHKCYPGVSIIPKQHYMIHFPSQILKYVHKYTYL